jgi:hypothetical protein
MIKIFFSYSHVDEALRDELEKHLSILKRQGLIELWHDRRIGAGQDFSHQISSHLEDADIILLLVSSDFLASDYCYDIEMKRALERHARGEAVVIPVILRSCDWHGTPFGSILAATKDGKPVTKFPTLDDGFLEVTLAIKKAIASIAPYTNSAPTPGTVISTTTPTSTPPRSSNLRIKRTFSDHEEDVFLDGAFNFVCNYFEGSLDELQRRNSNIQTRAIRVDRCHFTAKIYLDGKEICGCKIWYGGKRAFPGGLVYSNNADAMSDNSYNESLSVENDGYTLYLKPLGMPSFGTRAKEQLTEEGAAEYLWSLLIGPLQR